MAREIIEDHNIARPQNRDEKAAHPLSEAFFVDGAIEQTGRRDAIQTQRRHEGQGFPMPIGYMGPEPFASVAPAPKWGHVGFYPGLIQEDEPGGIDPALIFFPLLPPPLNAGAILLRGQHGFF